MYKVLTKRTPYGNEMLGKIKGFKSYLETAEKKKLEEWFYKIQHIFMIFYHIPMY